MSERDEELARQFEAEHAKRLRHVPIDYEWQQGLALLRALSRTEEYQRRLTPAARLAHQRMLIESLKEAGFE
jgi:hypothetical protein